MMNTASILERFDAEMRMDPALEIGRRVERRDGIVRAIDESICIIYSRLTEPRVAAAIFDEVTEATARKQELEWKIYGHDQPRGLGAQLASYGFAADEPETLMAFDLHQPMTSSEIHPDIAIRRIQDESGLADLIAVNTTVFAREHHQMANRFRARLADPTLRLYVAYQGGIPVAAGRLDLPPGRSFAGLWGGGTIPAFRKQGIYRALVDVRAREARRRGYSYLTVEARSTSRPILERLGFVPLTSVVGWILRPAGGKAPVADQRAQSLDV